MSLVDGSGRPVALGKRLGRGGEGEVFEVVGHPGLAAKVLHPGRGDGKAEKVRQMLAHPPAGAHDTVEGHPVLTWPRELLQDPAHGVVGYTMTRVLPEHFVPFFRLTSAARRQGVGGPALTWDRQVLLGMRLCHLVRTLHRFGYAVGDLNDRNVLVSRRLTPLLMDTDSFQVPRPLRGHHPCVVGDQLYWPPELLDVDLSRHKGSRETGDRYALGVLLFQLFMDGLRPYQARGALVDGLETVAAKTRAGHYPWARPRPGLAEPPADAPSYAALPAPVRKAFERCFVDGHRKPARRPTADEWHEVLHGVMAQGFRTCAKDARHVHAASERSCPWCADPNDRYAPAKLHRRLPRPGAPRRLVLAPIAARRPSATPPTPQLQAAPAPSPAVPAKASPTPRRPARQASPPKAPVPSPRRPTRPPAAKGNTQAPARRRRQARRRQPARWPLRTAWLALVVLSFAAPAFLLASAADGTDKRAVAAITAVALVGAAGTAAAWRWSPSRRVRTPTTWAWLTATACAAAYLVASGAWLGILWIAGVGWTLAGLALFAWLEARERTPFRVDARGWLHTAAGLPVAAVPTVVLWVWRALAR
jgi:hypothetical protein